MEVPLRNAPLERVLAQVRFPLVTSVEKPDFIAPFQEAIRRYYPILRREQNGLVIYGSERVVGATSTVWRFQEEGSTWRVSLAPEFLALETTQYTSRDDFLGRFERVLEALREYVNPSVVDRLGIRYIDRVVGDNLRDLPTLIRPEVAGIAATPLVDHATQSISESVFALPDGAQLMARWGLIPPQGTVDPSAVRELDEPSWLLDLDAFVSSHQAFDVDAVVTRSRALAERIYTFFRWTVTNEFLHRYGGDA